MTGALAQTGATFRKCDFQIHSPRDANWTGARPVGKTQGGTTQPSDADIESARMDWARELLDVCQSKGLSAIAITDHHEMVMLPYVKRAIEERRAANPKFDLWLFPGMELTAKGKKQCLILFDEDLGEEWWLQAQGALGIAHAKTEVLNAVGAPRVNQLELSYSELSGKLDQHDELKGRYIILPNVSPGGSHTVLVDGGHIDFRDCGCVGAYLDKGQTINSLTPKNRKRLAGKTGEWGDRFVYPIPTSDSREQGYPRLGDNNCWIKIAQPTAEALRQAFLAHQSRIRIEPPTLPAVRIERVTISGADPLADLDLQANAEFNCVIGGRGSGKSTVLEYIAYALGRSCYDMPQKEFSGRERLHRLIVDTLQNHFGEVSALVRQDEAKFKIVRGPRTSYEPEVHFPNGTKQTLSSQELRSLIPAKVYSQGELAEIGQSTSQVSFRDLLTFIQPEYRAQADQSERAIKNARVRMANEYRSRNRLWELKRAHSRLATEIAQLEARIKARRKSLPKMDKKDQEVLDRYENKVAANQALALSSEKLDTIAREVKTLVTRLGDKAEIPNVALSSKLSAAADVYYKAFEHLSENLTSMSTVSDTDLAALDQKLDEWAEELTLSQAARDAVIDKIGSHRAVAEQIASLQKTHADKSKEHAEIGVEIAELGDVEDRLRETRGAYEAAVMTQATEVQEWANIIEVLSDNTVRVEVEQDGDVTGLAEALENLARQTGSHENTRTKGLNDGIRKHGVWGFLDQLSADIAALLRWKISGGAPESTRPKHDLVDAVFGDTESIRQAFVSKLDSDRLLSLAEAAPRPLVSLKFCANDREIAFEKASEGQRASALLMMLMKQEGGLLIIDQPEGDLDNNIVSQLADLLHNIKSKRQMIFATHNANIVVNGAAELVVHMENVASGERVPSHIGAIDDPKVRNIITTTMEGGEKAFIDRFNKYGF